MVLKRALPLQELGGIFGVPNPGVWTGEETLKQPRLLERDPGFPPGMGASLLSPLSSRANFFAKWW